MARTPTGGRPGGQPKSIEEKRRLGNPGRRPLPPRGSLVALPPVTGPPIPSRPLGPAGLDVWDRVWASGAGWLSPAVDCEVVLILAEHIDERQHLRAKVYRDKLWRERSGLRALDAQIMAGLGVIGFTPLDRNRLGIAEVTGPSRLESLLADRATGKHPRSPA